MYNKYSYKTILFALALIMLTLSSCDDDKDDSNLDDDNNNTSNTITMSFKTTGEDETEYIISKEDIMTGEISAEGIGIEQEGWRFYYSVGKTLFVSGYSEDNQCTAYSTNEEGNIVEKGNFIFENSIEMFGHTNDNETFLGMEIPRIGFADRKLYFVDVNSAAVQKIQITRIYESVEEGLVAWPTALEVRGDKLFIPFHLLDSLGNLTTPKPDEAYVAIYSYPEMGSEPEKIITDSRTSHIGVNGATTGMIETEDGDLYSFSSGAEMAGFSPASTKPSGILRINSGETDFDESYFFNITEETNGGSIFWFDYVGNGKAIARVLTDDNGGAWAAYGRDVFNQKLVIIDLVNQTLTEVANVPLHAKRYSSPVNVFNGKVYTSIETATEAYIYEIDIDNATATKGAKIIGKTIKGFYKL